jgi:hypothetical protein
MICYLADSDGSPTGLVATLPITANCVVPDLETEVPEIVFTDCYLHFPYQAEFLVKNRTDMSACYCIVPQVTHLLIHGKQFLFANKNEHIKSLDWLI